MQRYWGGVCDNKLGHSDVLLSKRTPRASREPDLSPLKRCSGEVSFGHLEIPGLWGATEGRCLGCGVPVRGPSLWHWPGHYLHGAQRSRTSRGRGKRVGAEASTGLPHQRNTPSKLTPLGLARRDGSMAMMTWLGFKGAPLATWPVGEGGRGCAHTPTQWHTQLFPRPAWGGTRGGPGVGWSWA